MSELLHANIGACHRCENKSCGGRNKPACNGIALCRLDGRAIEEHAGTGCCPLNRFASPWQSKRGIEPKPRPTPKPLHEWPLVPRIIATLRTPADAGLGDTIHRHLERFGADAMRWIYKRIVGRDCGCGDRQQRLNRMFPYPSSKPSGS